MKQLMSRKFICAMAALASAHYLVANKLIADGVYSTVVIATIGAYVTANVAQRVMSR